ncbi:MAG TPA: hypothetical protein PLR07_09455, partial [Promineifilum sp.]|nr:hypothetical protein [Promineifilum sp.]
MPADGRALPDCGTSDAVRAAQERLLEIRRSLGIETRGRRGGKGEGEKGRKGEGERPFSPAQITNYDSCRSTNLRITS